MRMDTRWCGRFQLNGASSLISSGNIKCRNKSTHVIPNNKYALKEISTRPWYMMVIATSLQRIQATSLYGEQKMNSEVHQLSVRIMHDAPIRERERERGEREIHSCVHIHHSGPRGQTTLGKKNLCPIIPVSLNFPVKFSSEKTRAAVDEFALAVYNESRARYPECANTRVFVLANERLYLRSQSASRLAGWR